MNVKNASPIKGSQDKPASLRIAPNIPRVNKPVRRSDERFEAYLTRLRNKGN